VGSLLYWAPVGAGGSRGFLTEGEEQGLRAQLTHLTRGHRVRIAGIVGLSFLGGLAEAMVLLVIARVAFALTKSGSEVNLSLGPLNQVDVSVPALIIIAVVLLGIRFGLQIAGVWEQTALQGNVLMEVRNLLASNYIGASWALQADERSGRLQELATTFASSAASQVNTLANFLGAAFTLLAMLATALFANAVGTLLIGLAAFGLIAVMRPFRSAVRRRSRRNALVGIDYATAVSESASMMQELHVFGTEDVVRERLERLADENRRVSVSFARLNALVSPLFQSLAMGVVVGAVALVYAIGSSRLASLGAIVLIGVRALSYGQSVQSAYQSLHSQSPYTSMLAAERDRLVASAPRRGDRRVDRIDAIEVTDIAYSYDHSRRFALSGVSFAVCRGEAIGIVGPSGSGKSTLVQLLLRLRDPTEGEILADGVDTRQIDAHDWTKLVTFVPQDAHLFSGTVRENIRFFRSSVTDADVEKAAVRAHVHSEIMDWPDGYETEVGEQGRKLSGGQKQRLTIARALAGSPDVIILDEPTSSLDVKSESVIRDTMAELGRDAIVFIIAHRLSTLGLCDRIMVIQDGKLRAFDEPDVLQQSSPFYREALELSGLR